MAVMETWYSHGRAPFFFLRRKLPDVGVSVDFHPCPFEHHSVFIEWNWSQSLSLTSVRLSAVSDFLHVFNEEDDASAKKRKAKSSIGNVKGINRSFWTGPPAFKTHAFTRELGCKKRLHASAPLGINPPANEKLYWLLLKAPGHSCWTLNFRGVLFFLPQSFWSVWLGGNQADLKLSSSFFRVFSSFQLPCTPFLYSWTFYPQLYLFSLAHYFLAFFFSPCSGPCFCQFHAGPVLGESPRALETIRRLLPLPKNRPEFFIINHLLFSLSQLKS